MDAVRIVPDVPPNERSEELMCNLARCISKAVNRITASTNGKTIYELKGPNSGSYVSQVLAECNAQLEASGFPSQLVTGAQMEWEPPFKKIPGGLGGTYAPE